MHGGCDTQRSQSSVSATPVETIDLEPALHLKHVLIVVVNEGLGSDSKTTLGQLVEPIGDVQDRVALAELQEGPRSTAILRGHPTSPADTTRVESAKFERQELLDTHVVLPAIGEVVFVEETLSNTQAQIGQGHTPRISAAVLSIRSPMDDESVQVLVAPTQSRLARSLRRCVGLRVGERTGVRFIGPAPRLPVVR